MKKKHFILDVISFVLVIFNVISVSCFLLPPGQAYYLPKVIWVVTSLLLLYTVFGLGASGIVGLILNIVSIVIKKKKQMSIKNNIVYIVLFLLTVPLAWVLFNAAMSV
ncbi:MAG: hypothetical protein IJ435_09415 [Clostridia bacterium]|nr:hypothetical protein [Clostridia bacterium]